MLRLSENFNEAISRCAACMRSMILPSPGTCLSITPGSNYKVFAYPGKKHGMTFVVLPRKMEADFGATCSTFSMEAIQ